MRVAVLGGTGFIGHHVTRRLVEAGEDVTTIHRGYTPVRVPGVRSVTARSATLASALTAAAPHVLIDMAAYTGEDMERLLTAVPASLERLLVISSGDVYWTYAAFLGLSSALAPAAAVHEGAPLREQLYPYRAQAKGPEDLLYSYEKIVVERTARTGAGVPVTILRLPMVYGPEDPRKRVDPLDFGRSAQKLKTCEMSSQRTGSRLAPRSCSYTWGSLDAYRHAGQVARRDQTHDGSRDNDIRR